MTFSRSCIQSWELEAELLQHRNHPRLPPSAPDPNNVLYRNPCDAPALKVSFPVKLTGILLAGKWLGGRLASLGSCFTFSGVMESKAGGRTSSVSFLEPLLTSLLASALQQRRGGSSGCVVLAVSTPLVGCVSGVCTSAQAL